MPVHLKNNILRGYRDKRMEEDETIFQEGGIQIQKKWYKPTETWRYFDEMERPF